MDLTSEELQIVLNLTNIAWSTGSVRSPQQGVEVNGIAEKVREELKARTQNNGAPARLEQVAQ